MYLSNVIELLAATAHDSALQNYPIRGVSVDSTGGKIKRSFPAA